VENAAATIPESATDNIPALVGQAPDTRPVELEKLAALSPVEPSQAEVTKPEESTKDFAETSAASAPAAAGADAPVANAEVKIAAVAATPEPVAATPEPTSDIPPFEASIATTLIATLGGPAVFVDEKVSTTAAKPDRSAIRKRAVERARERRRMAAARRARLAREATLTLQQQQPNPFAFPLTPATR
jgi:hypothetical protein